MFYMCDGLMDLDGYHCYHWVNASPSKQRTLQCELSTFATVLYFPHLSTAHLFEVPTAALSTRPLHPSHRKTLARPLGVQRAGGHGSKPSRYKFAHVCVLFLRTFFSCVLQCVHLLQSGTATKDRCSFWHFPPSLDPLLVALSARLRGQGFEDVWNISRPNITWWCYKNIYLITSIYILIYIICYLSFFGGSSRCVWRCLETQKSWPRNRWGVGLHQRLWCVLCGARSCDTFPQPLEVPWQRHWSSRLHARMAIMPILSVELGKIWENE